MPPRKVLANWWWRLGGGDRCHRAAARRPEVWSVATRDQRDAYRALEWHINWRCTRKSRHPALEETDGATVSVFLTTKHMRRCLTAAGARKKGETAAREAIRYRVSSGGIEDTGTLKKPRRTQLLVDFAKKPPQSVRLLSE